MKKVHLVILLFMLSLTACLDFGDDIETASPTKEQVESCRSRMYLNPGVKIKPLGYKLQGSGIDDAVWFVFQTEGSAVDKLFLPQFIDVSQFKDGFTFQSHPKGVSWWQAEGKTFLGGQVELPKSKFMNVGIEKTDKGSVIYIMWHEI